MLNLTPHEIVVGDRRFPASGTIARVQSVAVEMAPHDGIPVVSTTFGEVEGMPEFSDVPVIVSMIAGAAIAASGRQYPYRVLMPDTGPDSVIRDESGKILGVRRMSEV